VAGLVCRTCLWGGRWDQLLTRDFLQNRTQLPKYQIQQSAQSGGLCCAILLALGRLFRPKDDVLIAARRSFYGLHPEDNYIFDWEFFIPPGGRDAPPGIPRLPLSSGNTASDEALAWSKYQLIRCAQRHRHCQKPARLFLPTRLIDVSKLASNLRGNVVVRSGADIERGSLYTTLSHCWGSRDLACLTTRENMRFQMEDIAFFSLPKTFQDAIFFTRRLGIRYLWIDSLCIIQDDPDDWAKEAAAMFDVYSNSHVTLAAACSQDSSGGLFRKRGAWGQFRLLEIMYRGEKFDLMAQRPMRDFRAHPNWSDKDNFRLFTRGWVFQERLISPRVLIFAQEGLMWECFTEHECESTRFMSDMATAPATNSLKTAYQQTLRTGDTAKLWRSLVSTFSGLKLSVDTDRLPAIGGIAKQIASIRSRDEYLAGLWSSTFLEDLMWQFSEQPFRRQPSKSWLAPSWSWASAMEPVEFHNDAIVPDPDLVIVGIDCTYAQENPFGPIVGGSIQLEGLVVECLWTEGAQHSDLLIPRGSRGVEIRFIPDFNSSAVMTESEGQVFDRRHLYLLRIGSVEVTDAAGNQGIECNVCLVLRKELVQLPRPSSRYRRMGLIPRHDRWLAQDDPAAGNQTWHVLPSVFEKYGCLEGCVIE
jgi:hypothetical protein